MPPAIMAIENATRLLSEAAEGLRQETQSPGDKKKLLDGSRGVCMCVRACMHVCVCVCVCVCVYVFGFDLLNIKELGREHVSVCLHVHVSI